MTTSETARDSDAATLRKNPRQARRRRARRLRRALGLLTLLFIALGAFALKQALAAKTDLERAKQILVDAKQNAFDRPFAATRADLDTAHALTTAAVRKIDNPLIVAMSKIPFAGRTAKAARNLAHAADRAVEAAATAADGLKGFVGADGKVHVGISTQPKDAATWTTASRALSLASRQVAAALTQVERAPDTWVPHSLSKARAQMLDAVGSELKSFTTASAGTSLAPSMLGLNGPKRYLIVMQNLAQARGLGGLIGGLGLVETSGGHIHLVEVKNNSELKAPKQPIDAPEWFKAKNDRFNAREKFQSVNVEPDMRVSGPLIAKMWEATGGTHVDGVIVMDPIGLAEFLKATGPIQGPLGQRLQADTFPKLVMSDAYQLFSGGKGDRKLFLADSMKTIFDAFLKVTDNRVVLEAFARASSGRHAMVWSGNAGDQAWLRTMNADGAFEGIAPATIGITIQNGADNKLDWFLHRSIDLHAAVASDGSIRFHLKITLANTAPSSGLDPEVLGPAPSADATRLHLKAGENNTLVQVYLPKGVKVATPGLGSTVTERSLVLSRFLRTPSHSESQLTIDWKQFKALRGNGRRRDGGVAIIRVPGAASDEVTIRITGPKGYELRDAGSGATSGNALLMSQTTDSPVRMTFFLDAPLWRRFWNL